MQIESRSLAFSLRWVDHIALAAGREMLSRISMATLAGDARMEKGQAHCNG